MSNNSQVTVQAFPYMSSPSLDAFLSSFDNEIFNTGTNSHLRNFMGALTGDAGVGDLVKQAIICIALGELDTIFFKDLDNLFYSAFNIQRLYSDSYNFDPQTDLLTSDQINEAVIADSRYRERLRYFLTGMQKGCTIEGIKDIVFSIGGVDCDVYEEWKLDRLPPKYTPIYYTLFVYNNTDPKECGYTTFTHYTIYTYEPIGEYEKYLIQEILDRFSPPDTINTVVSGNSVKYNSINIRGVSADSSYFELQKTVTKVFDTNKLRTPHYYTDNLYTVEDWLYNANLNETVAPKQLAYSTTLELSYYYNIDPTLSDEIRTVDYEVCDEINITDEPSDYGNNEIVTFTNDISETNISKESSSINYGPWQLFMLADSPDNYPGGKHGIHPMKTPALNQDGTKYSFPFKSQSDYVAFQTKKIIAGGGIVNGNSYKLLSSSTSTLTYYVPSDVLVSPVENHDTFPYYSYRQ